MIVILTISVLGVAASVGVGKFLLPEFLRELMTTVSGFYLSIINFCLKTLNNCLFLLDIFILILKKLSKFLSIRLFKMSFKQDLLIWL